MKTATAQAQSHKMKKLKKFQSHKKKKMKRQPVAHATKNAQHADET